MALLPTSQLACKVTQAVERVGLDLTGRRVLTEAATGAYAATPVIAAVASAEVIAIAKPSRYGTADEIRGQVLDLARQLDIAERIRVVERLTADEIAAADIVTNSGHLRPLDAAFIRQMKAGAAIPLMYETWELRSGEVDLDACRQRGIRVAGTNESHPNVRVFDYLGMLAVLGLLNCGVPVCFSRILLICDNPFARHIAKCLLGCGAELEVFADSPLPETLRVRRRPIAGPAAYDAVVVADTPGARPTIGHDGAAKYSVAQIGSFPALVQLWGDVERSCLSHVTCYPTTAPRKGHMGILLSGVGPDPVVRLQAAGLKVGEVLLRNPSVDDPLWHYCQTVTME
jgi:hypothetical protein